MLREAIVPSLSMINNANDAEYNFDQDQKDILQEWMNRKQDSIISIYATTPLAISAVTSNVQRLLRGDSISSNIMHYQFNAQDNNSNTIYSMLTTFVAQIYSRYPGRTDMLQRARKYNVWNEAVLYRYWIDLFPVEQQTSFPTIYLLSGLNQCKESAVWFLESVLRDAAVSEGGPKILIITQPTPDIDKILKGTKFMHVSYPIGIESSPVTTSLSFYDRYPSHLEKIGRKVLSLLLGGFAPLNIAQMGKLLSPNDDQWSLLLEDVLYHLRSIVIDTGESVGFLHSATRDLFSNSSDNKWYSFAAAEQIHEEIADSCIAYLSSDLAQAEMGDDSHPNTGKKQKNLFNIPSDNESPLFYIIKHWAEHFRLSAQSKNLFNQALRLFQSGASGKPQGWLKLHKIFSSSSVDQTVLFNSPLVSVSSFGLNTLVEHFIVNESNSNITSAIIEATRNKHLDTCKYLIRKLHAQDNLSRSVLPSKLAQIDCIREAIGSGYNPDLTNSSDMSYILYTACIYDITDIVQIIAPDIEAKVDKIKDYRTLVDDCLSVAIRHGNTSTAKVLLDTGANIHCTDEFGHSYLHAACSRGHLDICKTLVARGASWKEFDDVEKSPLMAACQNGKYAIVEFLCEDPELVKETDRLRTQPIMECVKRNFTKSLKLLLDAGVNQDVIGEAKSPLHVALENGHDYACKLLIQAKPTILFDEKTSLLLESAAANKNVEVMQLLLNYLAAKSGESGIENVDAVEKLRPYTSNALSVAAGNGNLEMIDCLLKQHADPNASVDGTFALHQAVAAGHIAAVQCLLDHNANTDTIDSNGYTPLQKAHASADITTILLNMTQKPNINRVTSNGTALFLACLNGCAEVVNILLRHGADPNEEYRGSRSNYPILLAVSRGKPAIVQLLLNNGANIKVCNIYGKSALHLAIEDSRNPEAHECLKVLLKFEPAIDSVDKDFNTALNCVGEATSVASVELLLKAGADPEITNVKGFTPLLQSIYKENYDVAECLINSNVNTNFVTKMVGGPIHLASKNGALSVIKTLITHGADLNITMDGIGGTPLQCALTGRLKEDYELQKVIICLLLNAKADINKRSGRFGYAINLAFLLNSPQCIELLLPFNPNLQIEDALGRNPAHMASLRTLAHVELLRDSPALFSQKDILGRNALHYAVGSGRLDVVKRVLDFPGIIADEQDTDNWTPLMWAARCHQNSQSLPEDGGNEYYEIMKFLIETHHANRSITSKPSRGRTWSPLKLARYHGASEEIQTILNPRNGTQTPEGDGKTRSKDMAHKTRTARAVHRHCAICLFVRFNPSSRSSFAPD
jgi:ankyrin repeat protein